MSRKFSITYFPDPIIDPKTKKHTGDIFRPKVPIQISYGNESSRSFWALVDSGSDRNLFPAELGELIGIDIKSVKPVIVRGIGDAKVYTFSHIVTLYIEKCLFEVEVDFCYEHGIPLLGRYGFFDQFRRIDFKEKKRVMDFKV